MNLFHLIPEEIVIQILLYHLIFSVPLVSTVLKVSVHPVELSLLGQSLIDHSLLQTF